jgi:hypothetical protein
MLWHLQLRDLDFHYVKHLFPKLFRNKDVHLFKCEARDFTKHHCAQFPLQPRNKQNLFL